MARGDCKEDMFLVNEKGLEQICSFNIYTLSISPLDLHPFMSGIDVARYALLSIIAPPFQIGGAQRDAPETIKYRGKHSI
jgi:hypothetical protein